MQHSFVLTPYDIYAEIMMHSDWMGWWHRYEIALVFPWLPRLFHIDTSSWLVGHLTCIGLHWLNHKKILFFFLQWFNPSKADKSSALNWLLPTIHQFGVWSVSFYSHMMLEKRLELEASSAELVNVTGKRKQKVKWLSGDTARVSFRGRYQWPWQHTEQIDSHWQLCKCGCDTWVCAQRDATCMIRHADGLSPEIPVSRFTLQQPNCNKRSIQAEQSVATRRHLTLTNSYMKNRRRAKEESERESRRAFEIILVNTKEAVKEQSSTLRTWFITQDDLQHDHTNCFHFY